MKARLGLPSGLQAMDSLFAPIIDGAMADHCPRINPRIATRADDAQMLADST